MNAQGTAAALGGVETSSGWLCHCPAHDDGHPSLSLADQDGKVLVYCHAGCTQDAVIDALRQLGLWHNGSRS